MAGLGRRSHYRKHLTDSVLNDFPEPTLPNQRVAKVVGTRGSNQFELIVAPPTSKQQLLQHEGGGEGDNSDPGLNQEGHFQNGKDTVIELDMTPQLSILPTKYRKLIWLKRNDYVICECAQDDNNEQSSKSKNSNSIEGGIRYMITHILYKDQVKNLKEKNLWPSHPFFSKKANGEEENEENERLFEKAKIILQEKNKYNGDSYVDSQEDDNEDENDDTTDYSDDGIVFSTDDDLFVNTNRIAKMKIEDSSSDEDSD